MKNIVAVVAVFFSREKMA